MERTILHVDMNNCFASIECRNNPEIGNKPVAVGGDESKRHGIVLAKNEYAKKFGIKTGETLWTARQKCPELVVVPPHFDLYAKYSRLARDIYNEYSDQVEPFGLDEVWIDTTGVYGLGSGHDVGDEIRQRIKKELGITVSVGVSYNKIFAKLGSDYKKPDAVTEFTKDNYREKLWPLPAESLLYVGRATANKLHRYGIRTIGEIARTDPAILKNWFGKSGLTLHTFANGYDTTPVLRAGDEAVIKSIGNSTTSPRDLVNEDDVKIVFYKLCDCVAERLRAKGFAARTVQISLRDSNLVSFERQMKLETPTCVSTELHSAAMQLMRNSYSWANPLRSIGVRAMELVPDSYPIQLSVFDHYERRERKEKLERTMDEIHRRYGKSSIGRAAIFSDPTLLGLNISDENHPFSRDRK